ncbi:MAG: hypothetical protein S4CHLAM81_10140 [Chlamydiales bacterium]|nr:hypothetical protein [Chlamydiales bacterium]MCH9635792.1 hypothetical protein [Chlamydiales bacterium]
MCCFPCNGVVVGLVKPPFLPAIAAVGAIAFPILAGISSCRGEHNKAKNYFHAWQFSVLTLALSALFLLAIGYSGKPKLTIGLISGLIASSIAFHLFRTAHALGN